MTTSRRPSTTSRQPTLVVRAGSPAALLRLIPHLLGFVPEASLIVIGVAPPRDRIRVTLRYDLPDPPAADLVAEIAAHALGVLSAQRLTAAVAVGYGPEALVTPVARELREAAWQAGDRPARVPPGRRTAATGPTYAATRSAAQPQECRSTPPPLIPPRPRPWPRSATGYWPPGPPWQPASPRSAASPRESMRQATRRAEQHIAQLLAKVRRSGRLGAARQMIAAEGLAAVGTMIARYRDGGRFTSDDEIARITVALRDLRVRDDAWARMDPAHSGAHQRLWIDVVRRAQPGYVAAPAALLAFVAWQSGDGALANVALDRALADDPRYSMALLLRQVITAGAPPALARLPMTPEEVAASYDGQDVDDPDPEMDDEH